MNFRALAMWTLALVTVATMWCACAGDPEVEAVKRSITAVGATGRTFETGPLEGGKAVLVDDLAAYWVKDGRVYAANGHAKAWSPAVSYVRNQRVTYDSVRESVR